MKAPQTKFTHPLGLFVISIVLILSQGCTSIPSPVPSTTSSLQPTGTAEFPPPTASLAIAAPTVTVQPTQTQAFPTSTPVDPNLPGNALARFNLGEIDTFALSPQRDRIAAANGGFICLYTTEEYERVWCKPSIPSIEMESLDTGTMEPRIRELAFRPDGKQIAIVLWNGYIVIVDASDGSQESLIQTRRFITDMVWSPDGKHITIRSWNGGIEDWEAETGLFVRQLNIDLENVGHMAWSSDGSLFATAENEGNTITIWDATQIVLTTTIDIQSEGFVSSLAFSPDNELIYAGIATPFPCEENCDPNDPGYKGWIAAYNWEHKRLVDKVFVGDAIARLAVSPDGKRVAGGGMIMGTFVVLDDKFGGRPSAKLADTFANSGLGWLDNSRVLYLPDPDHPDSKSLSQWDTAWEEHSEILLPGFETISSMAWLPDGERMVTNSAGGTISIWNVSTGERVVQFQLIIGNLPVLKFTPTWISPIEPWLAVGAEGSLAIVDLESRQVLQWLDHADIAADIYVVDVTWSKDGQRIAALLGDSAHTGRTTPAVWDVQTGKRLLTVPNEDFSSASSISLSPNGQQLAINTSIMHPEYKKMLVIVDIASGKQVSSLETQTSAFYFDWLSPDEIIFDNCDRNTIWNVAQQNQQDIPGSQYYPAISPSASLAASPCSDAGINVWDIRTGKVYSCLQAMYDHFWNNSLVFNPNGDLLASLTDYGSIIIWDVSEFTTD